MEAIHAFDGLMSLKQIDRLFFSGRGGTWPRERMRALSENGFVTMPDAANMHRVPLGETIYFLGETGAKVVAALRGGDLKQLSWRKKPRYSLISHDLALNDFRIDVLEACGASTALSLQLWIPESEFRAHPDKVSYEVRRGVQRERGMRPDGFLTVRRFRPQHPDEVEEYAFLLEIDMATEDNPRFAREKVRPGRAYVGSEPYRERFGVDYGRWLVVTTGRRRLANMKTQTERAGGEGLFYFTTFEQVSPESVLTQPIWQLAGTDELGTIIPTT
jgi:hypothetical protein